MSIVDSFDYLSNAVNVFNERTNEMVMQRKTAERMRVMLSDSIDNENRKIEILTKDLEISMGALEALSNMSDGEIKESYKFIEDNLNEALKRIFTNCERRIKLIESLRGGKTPQLTIELTTENGYVRKLKEDSGNGIKQLISLMSVLCIICLSGSRRFVVLDEVMNSLSRESRAAVDDILHSFAQIGFQFVIVEHGFISANSKVYRFEMQNGISNISEEMVWGDEGFYLSGLDELKDRGNAADSDMVL